MKTHEQKDSASGKSSSNIGEDRPKEILTESPSLKRKRTRDDEHENSSITPEQPPRISNERTTTPPPNVCFYLSIYQSIYHMLIRDAGCLRIIGDNVVSSAQVHSACTSSSFSTASPGPSKLKPAWSGSSLPKNLNEESECSVEEGSSSHVLVAATPSTSTEVEHHTGEENEDVKQEIKGVKFFIKRGDKPFSDGMQGHIKLLSDKTTLEERLLFRREPLWQVSLNIRLHPSIRCTFDANEYILRILVTEPSESKDEREIVVYALKKILTFEKAWKVVFEAGFQGVFGDASEEPGAPDEERIVEFLLDRISLLWVHQSQGCLLPN
ncbi:hypothetical protein C0993_010269 [Termitomyces sp. T159_Od127]|nr:hypothetical protein C0993_010269 [Termitomyces sp. T159_Od127]